VCLENTPFDERDWGDVTVIRTNVKPIISINVTMLSQAVMAGLVPAIHGFSVGLVSE